MRQWKYGFGNGLVELLPLTGVFPKPRVVASGARACPEQVTAQPERFEWGSCVQCRQSAQDPSLRLNDGFAQDDVSKRKPKLSRYRLGSGYFEFPNKFTHTKNAITAVMDATTRNAKAPMVMPIQYLIGSLSR